MTVVTQTSSPQVALQSYLDDLLQDAFAVMQEAPSNEFEQAVLEERAQDLARQQPACEPVFERPVVVAPAQPATTQVLPVTQPVAEASSVFAPDELDQPPAWAREPFECLLFDVAGLTLAVPLVSLGSIYPMVREELTPLFGQPDWFLGLLPTQLGNLKVVDSARAVLASRYQASMQDDLKYVISVQGYEWGLAVHQVSRAIRLDPKDVKWRGKRSQRPWLAGTVIEQMCALLDVEALAKLIASGAFDAR